MSFATPETLAVSTAGASLNLAAAIGNIVSPSGVAVGYLQNLIRWLSRSGVDEGNFQRWLTAASGLAYPNINGMQLSESIAKSDMKIQNFKMNQIPLPLTFSKALGRLIVKEPEVQYMASTVACLLTDHDTSYITSALTSMLLDQGGHETETRYKYEVWRAPHRAVISKIVESIFLNISNLGHQAAKLPPELDDLHVHVVDDTNFAAIVMQIHRSRHDLLLQTDIFPRDVILWLYNHFEGVLEVYVKSMKRFSKRLGHLKRRIRVDIKNTCPVDHVACDGRSWPVFLAEIIDGKPTRRVGGSASEDLRPCSFQRQKLYSTENSIKTTQQSHKGRLNSDQRNEIKHVARRIIKWLLSVPINIKDWPQLAGFCFRTELELNEDRDRSCELGISHLLLRTPSLLHENTGESTSSAPIFRRPQSHGSPISSQNTDPDQWGSNTTPDEILKNFPGAEALLENVRKRCQCQNCQTSGLLNHSKQGCLRHSAVLELCILISHAVADALGADDVSGALYPEDARSAAMTLLSEIIDEEIIRWDTCFAVAACVITGCSWEAFLANKGDPGGRYAASWAGVQFGSLAVLAPWLDFQAPLDIRNSFRVLTFEGSIEGVLQNLALLKIDRMSGYTSENPDAINTGNLIWKDLDQIDNVPYTIEKALVPAEDPVQSLLLIVVVNDRLRLIDPTRTMINLSRSQQVECSHCRTTPKLAKKDEAPAPPQDVRMCDFETMFARWVHDSGQPTDTSLPHDMDVSPIFSDLRKATIALALSDGGMILRDPKNCCLQCAIQKCREKRMEGANNCSVLTFGPHMQNQVVTLRNLRSEAAR